MQQIAYFRVHQRQFREQHHAPRATCKRLANRVREIVVKRLQGAFPPRVDLHRQKDIRPKAIHQFKNGFAFPVIDIDIGGHQAQLIAAGAGLQRRCLAIYAPKKRHVQPTKRRNTRVALVPPKPKLFDITVASPASSRRAVSTGMSPSSGSGVSTLAEAEMKSPCSINSE